MNKKTFISAFLVLFLSGLSAQSNFTQFVNPFVGTGGHGHTFPGATLPFAMVQLSPDTRIDGSWDGCSGYHYSDSIIYGFSHTHLSGTGCSDYGDIAFMPSFNEKLKVSNDSNVLLSSSFSHQNEKAEAGYYSVLLNNGIFVELSSTTRVGIQKYTYSKSGTAWITLNLKHRDELLEGKITEVNKHTFKGLRRSKAWAEDQLVYYYFELNRDAEQMHISKNDRGEMKISLGFHVTKGQSILIKTALSSVDEDGAKANLQKELPHWNFLKVKVDANQTWNKELNRIQVFGGTLSEKQNFYTALYHCMIHPNVMNDVDGRYRGRDRQIHAAKGFDYYTVFSLWDTYRALHPLLNIIDKTRSHDFIMTFKAQFEQSGRLPMWELWGNETNCMIGFHGVSVILDAYTKGVISLEELNGLYPAVKAEAMSNRFGLDKFREKGFLSIEDESESVSKTLEYSYDMWCVSMIARHIGDFEGCQTALIMMDDELMFKEYSESWVNLYNFKTGFMVPRSNGNWIKEFDPRQVNNHFTEANAWQYRFALQHQYFNVVNDTSLSRIFNTSSKTTGREQSDITGLIGQYAHGNEPSHHFAYLFENKDSTAKYVSQICSEFYHPTPDGLCGNEDCGQMSAWYVFSAMGFYPVCPGYPEFVKGKAIFDSVRINNVNLNAFDFFPKQKARPLKNDNDLKLKHLSAPLILAESIVFKDSLLVSIQGNNGLHAISDSLVYRINNASFKPYVKPFWILGNSIVEAKYVICLDSSSKNADKVDYFRMVSNKNYQNSVASFYKRPNNYSIQIKSTCNKQYTAGGPDGLLDGLKGDVDWRKGRWQGYQGQDFEAVVDMKSGRFIDSVSVSFLQDTRSWILFPKYVSVYASNDSLHYEFIGNVINTVADTMTLSPIQNFNFYPSKTKYRYLKIVAKNYGLLPPWHPGAGEPSFIFIDEIEIK